MSKVKACGQFLQLAKEFQVLSSTWSTKQIKRITFTFEDGVENTLAVPPEWEAKLWRLDKLARIVLLSSKVITDRSFLIVKKNLEQSTIIKDYTDNGSYLRINNFLFKLL